MKKDKYKKYGEKELKEEYNKEKGKFKSSKTEKQLDVNEVVEGYVDNEEVSSHSMDIMNTHFCSVCREICPVPWMI